MMETCKESITQADFWKLVGLLALAEDYSRQLDKLCKAALEITGEFDKNGHTSDAIYGAEKNPCARHLLEKLKIKVRED